MGLMSLIQSFQPSEAEKLRERQQASAGVMAPIVESYQRGLMQQPQQQQRTQEGFNIDLPQADFQTKAGLMSAFMEQAPNLDPTNIQLIEGMLDPTRKASLTPSAVREYEYWKNLPKKHQRDYMAVKRAQKFLDIGSGFVAPDPTDPTKTRDVVTRELKPTETTDYLAKKKERELKAKAVAEAQISFGKSQIQYDKNKSLIAGILKHKGLESAFGISSYAPVIRGTERAGFESKLKQLKNTVFITNREALKGGGSITDYEGNKAEEAELRASNAQSSEEFIEAIKDYEYWVDRGYDQLKRMAKGDFSGKKEKKMSPENKAAMDWAEANPNDPRAALILKKVRGR